MLLFWTPLIAASLHIVEEFGVPGGFMKWYRRVRPEIASSITPRFLIIMNVLLLILCYDVGAMATKSYGPLLWLGIAALLAANGVWHVVWSIRTKSYSPGLVTGILLYIPMAIYGGIRFIGSGLASPGMAALAMAAGASYQLWANMLHRARTVGKAAA